MFNKCSFDFNAFYCKQYYNTIERQNNKYHQLKQNWLSEAHHIRNFGENTQYRSTLKWVIAEQLWKNRNNPVKKIFLNKERGLPQHAVEFIFNEPFKTDPVFSSIDQLKVYLAKSYDTSTIFLDTSINDYVMPEYIPMFKLMGNHISVLSVIICVPPKIFDGSRQNFCDDIIMKLSHELTHAMDSLVDKIGTVKSGSMNAFISFLSRYDSYINEEDITNNIKINNVYDFVWIMKELFYYTQKTEIAAYLDTFYNQANKNNYDIIDIEIYNRYLTLAKLLDVLIQNQDEFSKKYDKQLTMIIEQLYLIRDDIDISTKFKKTNIKYTFHSILKYFQKQLFQFIRNAKDIHKQLQK